MLKLAYISKKILVALEPLDIGLARFVKYSLADLNILIISMLNNQPKALNWAFFIFIKFTKWIFRDKGEIMREIKFRGLNGETGWHYGIPLTNKLGTYIIFEKNPHICSQYHYIEIDEFEVVKKETVSQWTGLLDKNDVEIYEGDIVVYDDTPYNVHASILTGVVKMENQSFKLISIKPNSIGYRKMLIGSDDFFNRKSKVIGNIYENPELLEQI